MKIDDSILSSLDFSGKVKSVNKKLQTNNNEHLVTPNKTLPRLSSLLKENKKKDKTYCN